MPPRTFSAESRFSISFAEIQDQEAAKVLVAELERAHAALSARMGELPREPVEVIVYKESLPGRISGSTGATNNQQLSFSIGEIRPEDPAWQAGLRQNYARVLVERLSAGRAPAWLREGIILWAGESYEGEQIAWASRQLAGSTELFALSDLQRPFAGISAGKLPLAKAQSYSAFRLLLFRFGWRDVQTLLGRLANDSRFDEVFESVFRMSAADFREALERVWSADAQQKAGS